MAIKERSIKYNFILNWINTVVGIMFPIITFPYVSRVIGPEGLGIINFDQSLINYIGLIFSLGIGLYGVREISRLRTDERLQFHTTVEILLLHLLMIALSYLVVVALYLYSPRVSVHGSVFLVMSMQLVTNTIGAIWFFQAREDFKFIMVRSLIVKFVATVSLFVFVRTETDVMYYALIISLSDAGNNIWNFLRLNTLVSLKNINWRQLNVFRHLKPAVVVFAMSFIMKLYVEFPVVFLGFTCDEENVGYYTTATKLVTIVILLVSALGTAMLPRMSHYFVSGEIDKFRELERNGMSFTIALTIPVCIAMLVIAPELILSFSGDKFVDSIPVLRVVAPTVLFIGVATITGIHILYPQGKEWAIIKSAIVGFLVAVLSNVLFTKKYEQMGAGYSFLLTELIVMITMVWFGRRYLTYRFFNKSVLKFAVSALFMAAFLLLIQCYLEIAVYYKLAVEIVIGFIVYVISLALLREKLFFELVGSLLGKMLKK